MKRFQRITLWMSMILCASATLSAGDKDRTISGLSIRGSYWDVDGAIDGISVSSNALSNNNVQVGGAAGWLTFFSTISDYASLEFTLGGGAEVSVENESFADEEVYVSSIVPILLGFRHHLFGVRNQSALQPYLQIGGGPYVAYRVHVINNAFGMEEEATVKSNLMAGAYVGAGTYFMVSKWFGLQFDMKYHWVDFDNEHPFSGIEMGCGFTIMWER